MISTLLKKLVIFACSAIALSIGGYLIAASINADQKSYELPHDTQFLLVGHSHTACAVDPLFAKSVANLSASGESYFYMGAKVRKFIQSNPNLNTVLISISNNSVSKELDTWVASDFFIGNFMPKYYALLSQAERETLFLKNRNGYVYTLGKTTLDNIFYATYKYGKYASVLGGFERMEGDLDAWTRNASIRSAAEIVPSDTVSTLNLQYLEKMVSYLQKHQKEVILMRTPLHASFWNKCKNENLFQSVIREKFPTVKFMDFKDFPLQDGDFYDPEHLNASGAEKFSIHLEGVLKDMHAEPKPVTVGAYYFDGWRDNTNHLTNSLINSYSARKPGWGWNSAGQMQKEIKIASQAGINYFSFCWYLRADEQTYRHDKYNQALFEFIKLHGSGLMKFSLLVANHEGSLLTPANWPLATQLWIDLFKDANFLKVNEEPIISFFSVSSLVEQFGSEHEVRKAFEYLKNKARNAGLKGVKIAICVSSIQSECQQAIDAGADILSGYNHAYEGIKKENTPYPIDVLRTNSVATWDKIASHGLPVIPAVTLNWDPRPWSAGNKLLEKSHWFYGYSAASCEQSIRSLRSWINKNGYRNVNLAVLYAWNEYGEGAWLTPSSSDSLLMALKSGLK